MNALTVILLVANLLLLVAVLLVVLLRTRRGGAGAASPAADFRGVSSDIRQDLSAQRTELGQSLAGIGERMHAGAQATLRSQNELRATVESRFEDLRQANDAKLEQVRATVGEHLQHTLKMSLDENAQRIQLLGDTHAAKQAELQQVLREELEKLRQGNEAKLEKMRETVDEKLQGTLERRLGESFKLVSDRLEQVQKGLGEMQSLASDVGGLKRVLTNVKNRGSWGEVQLSRQLEDMLTPEQYAENVAVRPGSSERVEFAIKLPGRGEGDTPVWLPIDSKFPQEDYERLLEAQERGERAEIELAGKTVERVILTQAKLIRDKYIEPPHSTDFAVMYLPTEGLFAEVVRRPGLTSKLQNEFHVTVAGPTVLMSLLNSLQLGFRTLAIERRSSEVWQVLSTAKQEFHKYGEVWEKIGKQLTTVQNTVSEAGRRTRAVERRLRSVETLEPAGEATEPLEELFGEFDEADDPRASARSRAADLPAIPAAPTDGLGAAEEREPHRAASPDPAGDLWED